MPNWQPDPRCATCNVKELREGKPQPWCHVRQSYVSNDSPSCEAHTGEKIDRCGDCIHSGPGVSFFGSGRCDLHKIPMLFLWHVACVDFTAARTPASSAPACPCSSRASSP